MPVAGPKSALRRLVLTAAIGLALAGEARAHCDGEWVAVGGPGGSGSQTAVLASTLWDPDGPGPQEPVLVVAGQFSTFDGVTVNNVVTWNGVAWSPLGPGLGNAASWVDALTVLSTGELVAGGTFTSSGATPVSRVAKWDGAAWTALGSGMNNEVTSLAVASGGELYAGGLFTNAGGITANRVAKWNGSSWSPLGSGSDNGVGNAVYALAPASIGGVYIGGAFTSAGGEGGRRYVVRWTGSSWSTLGSGCNALVLALHVLSNGDLVAGGTFTSAGGQSAGRVARWNGSAWSAMGSGLNAQPLCFATTPAGELVAGGHFVSSGAAMLNRIARWDGSAWLPMGAGMDQYVMALTPTPADEIWAGGGFSTVEGLDSAYLARHDPPDLVSIEREPQPATTCVGGTSSFSVVASSDGIIAYAWEIERAPGDWVTLTLDPLPLPGGGSASALVPGAATTPIIVLPDPGTFTYRVRAVVSDACGTATSEPATLTICPGDLDDGSGAGTCDGGVDVNDLLYFLVAYEGGAAAADLDDGTRLGIPDGAVDINDLLFFLGHFHGGC